MAELETILNFVGDHGGALVIFIFALLIFLEKLFGTISNLNERFGIETKRSLERKQQKEILEQQKLVIAQHTQALDKLTELLDNQRKDMQVIKDLMKEQAQMFNDQKTNMERLFKHTAELAHKLDAATVLDEGLTDGVACLLRDRLKQAHKYYVKNEKQISATALENISEIFNVYSKKLHKNGVGEKMYNEIKQLPIKDEESF